MMRFGLRHGLGYFVRAGGAVLACVWCTACLRPAEQRAERDRAIGHEESGDVRIDVEGGLAAVRQLDSTRALLWASAPEFHFRVSFPDASQSFAIDIDNCMSGAQLVVAESSLEVLERARPRSAACRFTLQRASNAPSNEADAADQHDLTLRAPRTDQAFDYQFGVLSDVQEAVDRVDDVFEAINREPDLDFILGAGDLTEQGSARELRRFQSELESLHLPYYTTLGNHELGESPAPFQEYFGRANLSFVYRGVRFTLLDSASATIDPTVYGWLSEWLKAGRNQPHVVAMHIPPLDPVGVRNGAFASRAEAGKLLGRLAAGAVDMTLYGHIHSYYRFDNAGIEAHISGGGGAIPETFDGIGRHFLVVGIDDAGKLSTRVVRVD